MQRLITFISLWILLNSLIICVVHAQILQGSLIPVGGGFSQAAAVSADGKVVVGHSQGWAFRWTEQSGMQLLGNSPGTANDVSADGSVVVGFITPDTGEEAFLWNDTQGLVSIGDSSQAYGVSADGSVIVGLGPEGVAFRWSEATGMQSLDDAGDPAFTFSWASDVSADGITAVGVNHSSAYRWTENGGGTIDNLASTEESSWARAISADGRVIVGDKDSTPFRWTEETGIQLLGQLCAAGLSCPGRALATSENGSVIVGYSGFDAFIWTEAEGMRNLEDVLAGDYGLDLSEWSLDQATGVSADGAVIVGYGSLSGIPGTQAWRAELQPSTTSQTITGILSDLRLNDQGSLEELALIGGIVTLFEGEIPVSAVFTDEMGSFAFEPEETENEYTIRLLAPIEIDNSREVFPAIQAQIENVEVGSENNFVLPRSLATQKYELILRLEKLALKPELLIGITVETPLERNYNEQHVRALLESWLINVGENPIVISETLPRLVLAERVMAEVFDDAALLTHETVLSIIDLARGLYGARTIKQRLQSTITQELDQAIVKVISETIDVIEEWSKEEAIELAKEEILSQIPAPYKESVAAVFENVLKLAVDDNHFRDATLDLWVTSLAVLQDQIILNSYIANTQPFLDQVHNNAVENNLLGTNELATISTNSIITFTEQLAKEKKEKAETLRTAASVSNWLDNHVSNFSFVPGLQALKAVSLGLTAFSIAGLSEAVYTTGDALAQMPREVQQGTILAFDPDFSFPTNATILAVSGSPLKNDKSVATQGLAQAKNAYLDQLAALIEMAQQRQQEAVVTNIDLLSDRNAELTDALRIARLSLVAIASEAQKQDTTYKAKSAALYRLIRQEMAARRTIRFSLLEFMMDASVDTSPLTAQQAEVINAIEAVEAKLTELNEQYESIPVPAILAVRKDGLVRDSVPADQPFELQVTTGNYGQSAAESVTARLEVDSTTAILSDETVMLGILKPGEEKTISWQLKQTDPSDFSGTYTIKLEGNNLTGVSSTGTFDLQSPATGTSSEPFTEEPPTAYALAQNYPNPFNPTTTITYRIPEAGQVTIKLYDSLGREFFTLVNDRKPAGEHSVRVDASKLPNGVYTYRMVSGNFVQTRQMTVLK